MFIKMPNSHACKWSSILAPSMACLLAPKSMLSKACLSGCIKKVLPSMALVSLCWQWMYATAFLCSHLALALSQGRESLIVFSGPSAASFTSISAMLFNWQITSGLASLHPSLLMVVHTLEAWMAEAIHEWWTHPTFPELLNFHTDSAETSGCPWQLLCVCAASFFARFHPNWPSSLVYYHSWP